MRKITFFSIVDGVADAFPIAAAREFKFDWVAAVKTAYKSKMEKNKRRQLEGYKVRAEGVKCNQCSRALDDFDVEQCRESACPNKKERSDT